MRTSTTFRAWATAATAALALETLRPDIPADAAHGQVVLDQQNVFVSAIGDTANQFSQEIGQTFTVGIAGELAQVDVYLARFPFTTDNLVFRLYDTTGACQTRSSAATCCSPPRPSRRRRPISSRSTSARSTFRCRRVTCSR